MTMTIGELADRAGVNVQTVRYYERRGILPEPPRTPSGYRQYEMDDVTRIRFIKRAQELGFILEEIDELLSLRVDDLDACGEVEARTREKLQEVEGKLADLRRLRDVLKELLEACRSRERTEACPVLETLERGQLEG